MSLEDYRLPPRLVGSVAGDTYHAPGGSWSVSIAAPAGSASRRATRLIDAARDPRQTTVIFAHEDQPLEWSVDVLDASFPGEPALDADFMSGFFEWLATCDDAAKPGARELVEERTETLDGAPARWLHAEPGTTAADGERACHAVLVKRERYWVACLVKFPRPVRSSEAELRAGLTALASSFRLAPR
jgi:hypothetical protein